jgi:SAM-dependent methyltransferase
MRKYLINWFYFYAGIIFLLLAKIKSKLLNYTPKPFSTKEIKRCIEYDISTVDNWLKYLKEYAPNYTIQNKNILELGPGSDLGIGLYLLSKSIKKYTAIDVYDLVSKVLLNFYDVFFNYLEEKNNIDTTLLKEEFKKTCNRDNSRLNYVVRPDFNLVEAIGTDKIDVIFSNAAFEHFQNMEKTINDIGKIVLPGSILIISIDLKTHSRWIKEKDPNNIYRYSKCLYKFLGFNSSPNRLRPYQYKKILERNGWGNIAIKPIAYLDNDRLNYFKDYLNDDFKDNANQMNFLSVLICATATDKICSLRTL